MTDLHNLHKSKICVCFTNLRFVCKLTQIEDLCHTNCPVGARVFASICVTPSHVPCIFLSLAPKVLRTEQAVARTLCPFGAKRNRCVRCVCFDLCAKLRLHKSKICVTDLCHLRCALHTKGVLNVWAQVRFVKLLCPHTCPLHKPSVCEVTCGAQCE